MNEQKYYLIAPVIGDHVQVNELYAPNVYGLSENFTVVNIAALLKVKRATALDLVKSWQFEGICKEVI